MVDTTQQHVGAIDHEWHAFCNQLVQSLSHEGELVRPANRQGYRGTVAGNCFAGEREDSTYLHLGGTRAALYFLSTYRRSLHYSRLDLQVTIRTKKKERGYGYRQMALANAANARLPSARQRNIRHMASNKGGFTLYIGSPTSEEMGRIYDKHAESSDDAYENCWRWEVQLRNDKATRAACYLAEECIVENVGIAATVYDWYSKRGCAPDWARGEIVSCDFKEPKPKSDLARQLEWLQTQVKPTVARLIEAGYTREVFDALGLSQSGADEERNA